MAIPNVSIQTEPAANTPDFAKLFQALAEPTRLAVLQHLATGEHRVRDLVAHLDLAQSTVSKHLSFLLQSNLVQVRPRGRSSWYSLTNQTLLDALFAAAQDLLGEAAQEDPK